MVPGVCEYCARLFPGPQSSEAGGWEGGTSWDIDYALLMEMHAAREEQ